MSATRFNLQRDLCRIFQPGPEPPEPLRLSLLPPASNGSNGTARLGSNSQVVSIRPAKAGDGENKSTSTKELADVITAHDYFAKDGSGQLYVFSGGVYKAKAETYIGQQVKALMLTWGLGDQWSSTWAHEVCAYIAVDAPELWSPPPPGAQDLVNLENGILDTITRVLYPHTAEYLSTIQLPITYDPNARCPAWDQFVEQTFPADSQLIAFEVLGWLLTSNTSIQKALLLLGQGSNGKSVYLSACVAFLGKWNTTAISLHRLESDRFAAARLFNKTANICPDLPTLHLSSTSTFKALTGGDVVTGEHKFKTSFEFMPTVKLLFSANQPPHTDDTTHGFYRRWQAVPFTKQFDPGAPGTVSRDELDARLASPAELSGVLNRALDSLLVIRQQDDFTQSDSMRQTLEEFRAVSDPLAAWLNVNTVNDPAGVIPMADLMALYNTDCVEQDQPPMTKTAFGRGIRRARPRVTAAQRTVGLALHHVYVGLSWAKKGGTE